MQWESSRHPCDLASLDLRQSQKSEDPAMLWDRLGIATRVDICLSANMPAWPGKLSLRVGEAELGHDGVNGGGDFWRVWVTSARLSGWKTIDSE